MKLDFSILLFSIAIQALNVLLALRLIWRTKRYVAGGMIIAAVFLMAFRRGIALYRHLSGGEFHTDLFAESIALVISGLIFIGIHFATRIIESEKRVRAENEALIGELRAALAEIKTLQGIIPICSSCKSIRDDKGSWSRLEQYLAQHSAAEFSHGLCPDCAAKLYPEIPLRHRDTQEQC